MTGLRYRPASDTSGGSVSAIQFSRFVVRGKVVDEKGNGVSGIAIQIGPEVVYSDADGQFFLHVKSPKAMPLVVAPDSSLQTAWWRLQSAPTVAQGRPEGGADPLLIIVQTTRTMSSK
jgi:hypothetical protein